MRFSSTTLPSLQIAFCEVGTFGPTSTFCLLGNDVEILRICAYVCQNHGSRIPSRNIEHRRRGTWQITCVKGSNCNTEKQKRIGAVGLTADTVMVPVDANFCMIETLLASHSAAAAPTCSSAVGLEARLDDLERGWMSFTDDAFCHDDDRSGSSNVLSSGRASSCRNRRACIHSDSILVRLSEFYCERDREKDGSCQRASRAKEFPLCTSNCGDGTSPLQW